jgi:hypothetical protein
METEARHYLREVLMAVIHAADEGCDDWRIADALLDAGEITWNYQILPEPQLATFQLIFTATDAEPAEQPDPITPEVYGEFFPERDDAGEPLSAEPARGGTARGGTVTAVPDTHPGFAVLDPTAPLDHAVLDRLEVVSHNGVDDREGWSEITMRDRPEDGR